MLIAKKTAMAFDVIGVEETMASISRDKTSIQLSWINELGELERYKKISLKTLASGSLLRYSESFLIGTGDRKSAVAILLANLDDEMDTAETKTIDGKTAYLLPVLVL